jgi:hypothetical protein
MTLYGKGRASTKGALPPLGDSVCVPFAFLVLSALAGGGARPTFIYRPPLPHPWWLVLPMRRADRFTFSTPFEGICILREIELLFRVNGVLGQQFICIVHPRYLPREITHSRRSGPGQ